MGFLAARGEASPLLGTTWNGPAFDRDGVVTCYLGGSAHATLLEQTDEALGRVAVTEFERMTGDRTRPLAVHRWSRGMPAYDRT